MAADSSYWKELSIKLKDGSTIHLVVDLPTYNKAVIERDVPTITTLVNNYKAAAMSTAAKQKVDEAKQAASVTSLVSKMNIYRKDASADQRPITLEETLEAMAATTDAERQEGYQDKGPSSITA